MAKAKTPNFDIYEYSRQSKIDYFHKRTGDNRLPDELRTEPIRDEDKYKFFGVRGFLVSRQKNGFTAFKTGLQGCNNPHFYSGDILEAGVKSLVAVAFNEDSTILYVFVFRRFYKDFPKHRLKFVNDFLTNFFKTKNEHDNN